jgi:flagellar hook-associated protein 2
MASSVSGTTSANSSTGLGAGIDVNAFVQSALANDQANITQLQNQQGDINTQSKALAQITSDLNALQSAVFALKDPLGSLAAQSATSSNNGVLTASASSTALAGTHTITVNNLATTSSYYTGPVSSSNTALGTGSFQLQVGSATPVTVTVDSTNNTLDGLAANINNLGIGVRASVIDDANGARLALVSETTGAPGDITVSGNTTSLNFIKAVTGTNASLVVDGVPISSTGNAVSGVINGVTINLASASPNTSTTLTVAPDTTQATNALNQFVTAYNAAAKGINAQFAVAADGSGGGPLEADGSLREAQSALLGAISYSVTGNNGFVNLQSIGISLNDDGTLSVNQGTLSTNLAGNFSSIQNFLQSSTNGFANNLDAVLTNLSDPSAGTLGLDAKSLQQSSRDLGSNIADLQAALAVKQQNLILVYSQVNATLEELPLLQRQLSQQLGSV